MQRFAVIHVQPALPTHSPMQTSWPACYPTVVCPNLDLRTSHNPLPTLAGGSAGHGGTGSATKGPGTRIPSVVTASQSKNPW